ncbi:Hypothetical predicted protein, partial [Marmota monax]
EEPWDQDMEVFGGGGGGTNSGEVSVVAKIAWSQLPLLLQDPSWGPREKGRGGRERGSQ